MTLSFAKMHGLGNDFVLLDGVSAPPPVLPPATVQALADRRRGIGFDQLLLLTPPPDESSDFYYHIYNADGSAVGQCGNGARCAHAFLHQRRLTDKSCLQLTTDTTRIMTQSIPGGSARAVMQPARFLSPQQAMGFTFFHLDIGNPHYVCMEQAGMKDDDINRIGAALNREVASGVNVGFAGLVDGVLQLRVYERGAGLTAACGSGALAAAVVAITRQAAANPLPVYMPGGELLCGINESGQPWLEGEIAHVFDGTLPDFVCDDK